MLSIIYKKFRSFLNGMKHQTQKILIDVLGALYRTREARVLPAFQDLT